jgi:hypothetical protein
MKSFLQLIREERAFNREYKKVVINYTHKLDAYF